MKSTKMGYNECSDLKAMTEFFVMVVEDVVAVAELNMISTDWTGIIRDFLQLGRSQDYERAKDLISQHVSSVEKEKLSYSIEVARLGLNDYEYEHFRETLNWSNKQINKINNSLMDLDEKTCEEAL